MATFRAGGDHGAAIEFIVESGVRFRRTSWLLWGTFVMLLLATLEELSQRWLSNRTLDAGDLACNYLGILIIGHLPWLFRRNAKAAGQRL